jgi:inhibitor of the pro-sigma K processing machinery
MVALIVLLLIVGAPVKPMRFIGHTTIKIGIGILFLFFVNVFGGAIGLHIPINLFTVIISGFLGLFGVASLAAIHLFIIP